MADDDMIPMIDDEPIELSADSDSDANANQQTQIRAFGEKKRHEDNWARSPNVTGAGAIHVKTFHAKLRVDALEYMDQQVNEWLDAHPQYEVKFVTSNVGELRGKTVEQALFLNVWV